ncbi:tetratricopeptide repeat-containing sensor histidine kinase [Aestuariibaculum sediminum]|uniref:Oxygen sensor histidine kinase NreB n=1 Tax=Aestuariibaculum sediminum TaxID=2770637 RepID=A0A8J6Q5N2_9FLAO|nr:sensor histidine kinase [Aestuariibaculum sediminum]MBD0830883.1 sensor histidine kinase [Aestuariibaculum sediminum]
MKHLIKICLLFSLLSLNAQQKDNLEKIDSIRRSVSNFKVNDSSLVANAHFNIAEIYRYSYKGDSAYYHYHEAQKIYQKLQDNYKLAKTLYGLAVILKNEKDLTASEIVSIQGLELLEPLRNTNEINELRAYLYNNLGGLFGELEQFDQSITYFEKAISIKESLKGNYSKSIYSSKNNLAFIYKRYGKYDLALELYQELLNNEAISAERPDYHALVMDNFAHTKYLSKSHEDLPELYFRALQIADSVNPRSYNSIIINQHLAEFYNNKDSSELAKYYANRAKDIAEQYHNDELLSSLLLLSKIEAGENAAKHLREYVRLSDSLQKNERELRNKFARIQFETEQIERENVQFAKERMWLFILSVGLLITSFLLYLVITQRNKNRQLRLIQKQQEANEEIYNLMLSQNEKIEEARAVEKKRISQELHDGVLGRLFGTRLSLDSLNYNNTPEAIDTRGQYISELKKIEEDIRKVSHELNTDFVSGSGFIDIIKTLIETQTLIYELEYTLEADSVINWDQLSNKMKIHIYRIVQESLHNIHKHANATHVDIGFKLENNVICMSIEDNGTGFDVNKSKAGIGLKNMRARIKEIDGVFNIISEKGQGTQLTIEAPIA